MVKYYVAKARVWPYNSFYFIYPADAGFPILDVVNPADYNIYEATEEEYNKHANKK